MVEKLFKVVFSLNKVLVVDDSMIIRVNLKKLCQDIELVEGFLGEHYFEESNIITITEDQFRSVLDDLRQCVPADSLINVLPPFNFFKEIRIR